MKGQLRGFVAGILVTDLSVGLIATASAVVGDMNATLNYNNIKITLDNQAVTPKDASGNIVEPFAINGTTYLPVRGIADALGLGVEWDQATQTVKLTTGVKPLTPATQQSTQEDYIYYSNSNVPMLENFVDASYTGSSPRGDAMLYFYPNSMLPAIDESDENNYISQFIKALIASGMTYGGEQPDRGGRGDSFIFTYSDTKDGAVLYVLDPTMIILVGDTTTSLKSDSPDETNTTKTKVPAESTEPEIKTAEDLEAYFNQNMGSLETPLGTYNYTFKVDENDADYNPYDFLIKVDHDGPSPWYDIEYSISISQSDKDETLALTREFQEEVYNTAAAFFPDKKLTGCYYDFYYEYPNIRIGYHATQVLTWCNFTGEPFMFSTEYADTEISSFHWYTERDDYKFD